MAMISHKYEQSEASTGDACMKMVLRRGNDGDDWGDTCGLQQAIHRVHNPDGRECAAEECGGTRLDPCTYTVEQWLRIEAGVDRRGLSHKWHHDGFMSGGSRGRICQVCRFREGDVIGLACFGSPSLHDAAYQEGVTTGTSRERERIRQRLGL